MENDLETVEIPAEVAARALGVPYRTFVGWLQREEREQETRQGKKNMSGRRLISEAQLRQLRDDLVRKGRQPDTDMDAHLREWRAHGKPSKRPRSKFSDSHKEIAG